MTVSTVSAEALALAHAVADDLAAAELHFLAVDRVKSFSTSIHQLGIGQTQAVAGGRAEHFGIGLTGFLCS
jgi:hypothetical protein